MNYYKRSAAGAQVINITGDLDGATAIILNVSDTTKLEPGMPIEGTGIQAGSVIDFVDSTTQITLDKVTTIAGPGVALTVNSGTDLLTIAVWDLNESPLTEITDDSSGHTVWALNLQWREMTDEIIANNTRFADYYTKVELDGGQLDNRYYTETELDSKFADYYTKVNLDGGQLDNRYYTETELDSKFAAVTLDSAYDNESGIERIITVDDENISFWMNGKNVDFNGYYLTRFARFNPNSVIGAMGLEFGDWNYGGVNVVHMCISYNEIRAGMNLAGDRSLRLGDHYISPSISLGETGVSGLSGFTKTSLVGGLNELKVDVLLNNAYRAVDHIPLSQKGSVNGVAELDAGGKVPTGQLPSYVDDVLEYANFASLPVTGETEKIYVTLDDNKTYRWSGSAYVEISASLALGETSATAYRGDRGKIAYDHSQLVTGNPHVLDNADIGLGNVTNDAQIAKSIGTTKGDIIAFTGSAVPVRLPIGTNTHVLTADSAEASGVKWVAPGGGSIGMGFFVRGSLLVGDAVIMLPVLKGATVTKVIARVITAPTGAALTLNVQKNGANDILSADLSIAAGANTATSTSIDTNYDDLVENDFVTLDINQVGSTLTGANLMVGLVY